MPSNQEIDEAALRVVSGEAAEADRKAQEKKRFLEIPLGFDDMFRQACAQVYFMKTQRVNRFLPGSAEWESAKTADKHLSRFKYNRQITQEKESYFAAALQTNRFEDAKSYKEEADRYLTKCLHAHYVIGVLFGQFMRDLQKG